ncbi:MAG: hypothetical protein ACOY3I_07155 [Verrucomicrobiota bacterium]
MSRLGFVICFFWVTSSISHAIPAVEANGDLWNYIKQIRERDAAWNKMYNNKTREVTTFVNKMEDAIRQTSDDMKKIQALQKHASLLNNAPANSSMKELEDLDLKSTISESGFADPSTMLKYDRGIDKKYNILLGGYYIKNDDIKENMILQFKTLNKVENEEISGMIEIPELLMSPPYWLPNESNTSAPYMRSPRFLIKVSAKYKSALAKRRTLRGLERDLNDMACMLLPQKLLRNFNPQDAAARLLAKAGVVHLGDGVVLRPSAYQDRAYNRFVGLKNRRTDEAYFWSDPMVMNGYHPLLGNTLNATELAGCKQVDMDNIVSEGYSGLIDRWNRLKQPYQRVKNPFKGYAAQVVPGLFVLAERGQFIDDQPTPEQLDEAVKISRTHRVLPSQVMRWKKVSFTSRSAPRVILVAEGEEDEEEKKLGEGHLDEEKAEKPDEDPQKVVELDPLQKDIYIDRLKMIRRRLKELDAVKKANRLTYKYVNDIIKNYVEMENQAQQVSKTMLGKIDISPLSKVGDDGSVTPTDRIDVPIAAIPQITQFRQDIAASLEKNREYLSDLQHEFDDLRQREWVILEELNQARKKAILSLMDTASMRYRIRIQAEEEEAD